MHRREHNFKNKEFPLRGVEFVKGEGFVKGRYLEEGQLLVTFAIKYVPEQSEEYVAERDKAIKQQWEAVEKEKISLNEAKVRYPDPKRDETFTNMQALNVVKAVGGVAFEKSEPIGKDIISVVAVIPAEEKAIEQVFYLLAKYRNIDPQEIEFAINAISPIIPPAQKQVVGSHTANLINSGRGGPSLEEAMKKLPEGHLFHV